MTQVRWKITSGSQLQNIKILFECLVDGEWNLAEAMKWPGWYRVYLQCIQCMCTVCVIFTAFLRKVFGALPKLLRLTVPYTFWLDLIRERSYIDFSSLSPSLPSLYLSLYSFCPLISLYFSTLSLFPSLWWSRFHKATVSPLQSRSPPRAVSDTRCIF